jgi:hypothetical protein
MKDDETARIGRRALLGAAVGGAAAAAAAALAAPSAVLGANGDAMHVGEDHAATATTSVTCTGTHAIAASTNSGDALRGGSTGGNGSGTFGYTSSPTGYGVFGYNMTNAGRAALGAPQAALWASQFSAPLALKVEGKASFSRSGRATVLAGKSFVDVNLGPKGGLGGTPLCFANLLSYRAGVYVAGVRPNYPALGRLRIYLNRSVTSAVNVAWLVLG